MFCIFFSSFGFFFIFFVLLSITELSGLFEKISLILFCSFKLFSSFPEENNLFISLLFEFPKISSAESVFLFSSCASNDLSVPVPGQGTVKTRNIYVEYYMLGDAYFKLEDYKKAGVKILFLKCKVTEDSLYIVSQ